MSPVLAVEVERDGVTLRLGFLLVPEHGRIVAGEFGVADSPRGGAIKLFDHERVDGGSFASGGTVQGTRRGDPDDKGEGLGCHRDEFGSGREQEGADVERTGCAVRGVRRDKLQVFGDGRVARLVEHVLGQFGHRDNVGRVAEALGVLVRAEQLDLSVRLPERLEAFEATRAIVERDGPDRDLDLRPGDPFLLAPRAVLPDVLDVAGRLGQAEREL